MDDKIHNDLTHIREMMEKSTRFFSLSGWAGILAGLYALVGAYFAYDIIYKSTTILYYDIAKGIFSKGVLLLLGIALSVFVLAVLTALYTSYKAAAKEGGRLWSPAAVRMIMNMLISLVTGGILGLILIQNGTLGLVAPISLIFYGLSLILASNYTYSNIKILGFLEILLGLISAYYQGYGLFFWAMGFGVFHIIYGILLYFGFEKK